MKRGTGDVGLGGNQDQVNTTFQKHTASSLGGEEEKELVTFLA